MDHLKRSHPLLRKQEDQQEWTPTGGSQIENDVCFTSKNGSSKRSYRTSTTSISSTSARSSLRSLSLFLQKIYAYDDAFPRKKELDKALIEMIVIFFQPFIIVKDVEFKKFAKLLDSRYTLPSPYTVREKLRKTAYLDAYNRLKV